MSFTKLIEQPTGVDVRYWRVEEVNTHYRNKTVIVLLSGYVSKAKYLEGKTPVIHMTMGTNTAYPLDFDAVRGMNDNQLENYILANAPYFAGGTSDGVVP